MSDQPEALRLADALSAAIKQVDDDDDVIHVARWFVEDADAELRRLVAEHEEDQRVIAVWRGRTQRAEAQRDALRAALELALSSHGVMLLTDPPQEAWKVYGVEAKARAAIDAVAAGDTRAEPVEPAQQTAVPLDTRRLDWLEAHAIEEFVRPETIHSEFADLRMRWALPKLQSYNSIGSRFTVREAIDIELEKESGDAAE